MSLKKFNFKIKFTLVGKGCFKKRMSYYNNKNKYIIYLKKCWLKTNILIFIKLL